MVSGTLVWCFLVGFLVAAVGYWLGRNDGYSAGMQRGQHAGRNMGWDEGYYECMKDHCIPVAFIPNRRERDETIVDPDKRGDIDRNPYS